MHDVIIVGVPLIAILAGILLNRQDVNNLRAEVRADISSLRAELQAHTGSLRNDINSLRADMVSLRDEMHREFREFYRTLGQHDARIDALEKSKP